RERGLSDLRACAPTYQKIGIGPGWTPWRSVLALAIRGEDREYAEGLMTEELDLARASGVPEVQGAALRSGGLLAGGDAGIELLRESVAILEQTRARFDHARSVVELRAALRRRHRAAARAELEAGMDLAHRCGAERLVQRA